MNKIIQMLVMFIAVTFGQAALASNASWYGPGFNGQRTASGDIYNMYALTAAHMNLPFGSKVRVTNVHNKKSVVVKINDRGGFSKYGRIIDLSKAANNIIDCHLCTVTLKVLERGDGKYRKR